MQIILQRDLSFEVKIPSARPVDISALSEVEFNEELEKGYADMQAGRTKNARKVFSDIRKDYGIIELVYIVLQSVVKPGITGFFKIDLHIKCYIYLS